MKKGFILLFIISIIFTLFAFSNNSKIKVHADSFLSDKAETLYDVSNGLVTGKANTICQTDDGYIWIGQYAGLTRYDSKNFKTITSFNGINLTSIVTLANYKNILLIGSEKGFFIRKEDGNFRKIETDDASLVCKDIKVIDEIALVGTSSGLFKYDIQEDKLIQLNNLSISRITVVSKDNFYYLVGKNKIYHNKQVEPIYEGSIKSITYYEHKLYVGSRNGNLYVLSEGNDGLIDKENITSIQVENVNITINDILINRENIFLCADDGLFTGNINDLTSISKVKSYIKEYNKLEKIFIDY